jgi:L-seryl-tRNA(Ser) seleniumtransferase
VTEPFNRPQRITPAPPIYEQIGVRTIINGRGATTAVGGTLMDPEVLAAMAEASRAFVVLDELNAKVGEKIAELTGAQAGYVTSGSAAGMALSAAACIAGCDPALIQRLPDSSGLPNEIVIHRAHRLDYDIMYRLGGARLVEIGVPMRTERWELERAIGDSTAAVAYHDSRNTGPGALDFTTVAEVAHGREVPVIVDAASTLPPVDHLRRWIDQGADLVIFSGGKGIRGPQDTGLLAGRADLIDAARANGSPNAAIGRGMKVSKEAMAGLWMALERFTRADHAAERERRLRQARSLADAVERTGFCRVRIEDDWELWPAPVIRFYPIGGAWSAAGVSRALSEGNPSIHIDAHANGLQIGTHCLAEGEERVIAARLSELLSLRRE